MSIFKCKMCGGELHINPGESVAVCEYCGTTQTLPKLDDDRRANLYDRANHFRRNNDFDKAAGIYEQILNEDKTDAEAYWSLVLCRYGIEYVEDPATHKRVPTVNRAQYTSIFDDEDYKAAIQYADAAQRVVYEAEAKAINEIQKGILEISQKEEPFDVFICYKETDANGRRTPDSVLATDLYHQLTQESFKVFFSRITLEDKLGTAYEPYIFAALNSAKVMVVLGTKPEYFNAVWVKNEWSRYLALIRGGAKKVLIPAYRDMDPYDLPEEFSHLQAQDMSKLGFMQDLIRGIKKLTEADKPAVRETVVVQETTANTAPLLKRAFIFLEDGDWSSADEYCEKVLDIDPENAQAYLGKLMAEQHVHKKGDLQNCELSFEDNDNFRKTIRFGDESLRSELYKDIERINGRIEERRKDNIYAAARSKMGGGKSEDYEEAIELLQSIPGWKDAEKQVYVCQRTIEEIREKEEIARLDTERKLAIAAQKAAVMKKRILTATVVTLFLGVALVLVLTKIVKPYVQRKNAIEKYGAEFVEKVEAVQKGETLLIGSYEQDNNVDNGKEPVEWIVLEKDGLTLLLISKNALECKTFNTSNTDVTWETSTIRKWLNVTLLSAIFSADDQTMILRTTVSASKNPEYNTSPGNTTVDKIFLLSIDEAQKYLPSDEERKCTPTNYASSQGGATTIRSTSNGNSTCWWWLRSPGIEQNNVAGIYYDGKIHYGGYASNNGHGYIRPALRISLAD